MSASKELPDIDEWKINFAVWEGSNSPLESARKVQEIARIFNIPVSDAAKFYSEYLEAISDPRVQESIRQWEAGKLKDISPPDDSLSS